MRVPRSLQLGLIPSASQTSGSDRYYFDLLGALRAHGARIDGLVYGDPLSVDPTSYDVHAFAPEGSGARVRWPSLRRAVRPYAAASDLVVSHFAPHTFPVLDIIRKRPLVEHFHGPWALEGRYAGLPARTVALRFVQEFSVYSRADRIVVLSQAFATVLRREYRISQEKIRIVPGGVDVARFAPVGSRAEAREELGLPQDRPIVVSVRRLESTKGIDRLIDAAEIVVRAIPDTLFVIAGTGSLAGHLATRVDERDLERSVVFLGKIDDSRLAKLYRAADVSVVPSVAWEGFGLVCLESLASGTPALVTPVGGLPEAVAPLDSGLVFGGVDVADLAVGLRDALSGAIPLPDEAACIAYARRFSWTTIATRVNDVYCEVA